MELTFEAELIENEKISKWIKFIFTYIIVFCDCESIYKIDFISELVLYYS